MMETGALASSGGALHSAACNIVERLTMTASQSDMAVKTVDVRPILRDGGEPFQVIMEAVRALAPGESLRLLTTFQPTPLFKVMATRGFSHAAFQTDEGDWDVLFTPSAKASGNVSLSVGAEEAAGWPEPLWRLDLTGFDAPDALARLLSRLDLMDPGEVLFALFAREPVLLPAELSRLGHQWAGNEDGEGKAYRMLIRVGGD